MDKAIERYESGWEAIWAGMILTTLVLIIGGASMAANGQPAFGFAMVIFGTILPTVIGGMLVVLNHEVAR